MADVITLFSQEWADGIFPAEKTNDFFDALYGDCEDGAYDIKFRFVEQQGNTYRFNFELHQRPGQCLACNLTYGLPQVFARHPVINLKGLVEEIAAKLGADPAVTNWTFSQTEEISKKLHLVPLIVTVS